MIENVCTAIEVTQSSSRKFGPKNNSMSLKAKEETWLGPNVYSQPIWRSLSKGVRLQHKAPKIPLVESLWKVNASIGG